MFARILKRNRPEQELALAIYTAIVAQARQPALYRDLGVPDTIDGRFEMIVLHQVLLFHRIGKDDSEAQPLVQEVFDTFVSDMDSALREMGVSDLGVPKRMKAMAKSFYGRLQVYGKALADNDRAALAEALQRNLHPDDPSAAADGLADYATAASAGLRSQSRSDLLGGRIVFPDPAAFVATAAA